MIPATAAGPLKLRMRPDLVVRAQRFGGRRYLAVKDPLALRYYHFRDEEFFILQRLDGRTSAEQILAEFSAAFAPRRLKPAALQQFLAMLHREGLVVAEAAGQGPVLLERQRQSRRRQRLSAWSNPLAIRFRGVDPQPWLDRLYPRLGWLFTPAAVAAMLLLVLAAVLWVSLHLDQLQQRLPTLEAFFHAGNLVWFVAALALTKILHELAHGLTCRHFGGECHELGVMLLVFTPCLYVNVSDSWMLPDKWQRMAIAAAGMAAELVLAAACTFVWWFSSPGLLNSLCLQVMLVSSVGTVLFNANPLLPYDGYYLLADWLEVPNLRQRAQGRLRQVLAAGLLGIELPGERIYPERGRRFLLVYAVAAAVYRLVLVAVILWFLHRLLEPHGLQVLAQLLTLLVVGGMLAVPAWRGWRFVSSPVRRPQVNFRRLLASSLILVAALGMLLAVPLPHRVSAPLVLEPQDARRVFVTTPGRILWSVEAGAVVRRGDPVARLENPELALAIEQLRGQREILQTQLDGLRDRGPLEFERQRSDRASRIAVLQAAWEDLDQQIQQRLNEQQWLTLRAPIDGTVLAPRRQDPREPGQLPAWDGSPLEPRNRGAWLAPGSLLCLVGEPRQLAATLLLDQADLLHVRTGQRVHLQLDQLPGRYPQGVITEVAQADLKGLPAELLAAGRLPVRGGPGPLRLVGTWYQARVRFSCEEPLLAGGTGRARVVGDPLPLGRRIERYLRQTFR